MDSLLIVVAMILIIAVIGWGIYEVFIRDLLQYRKAKRDVYAIMMSYKARTTGQNRFIVTVETLSQVFPDYDRQVLSRIWLELVHEKIVRQDVIDNEWVIN